MNKSIYGREKIQETVYQEYHKVHTQRLHQGAKASKSPASPSIPNAFRITKFINKETNFIF